MQQKHTVEQMLVAPHFITTHLVGIFGVCSCELVGSPTVYVIQKKHLVWNYICITSIHASKTLIDVNPDQNSNSEPCGYDQNVFSTEPSVQKKTTQNDKESSNRI